MFRCQHCYSFTERGQPANKVVTAYRQVEYENIVKTRRQSKRHNLEKGDIWISKGREIEKEIDVCPKCCIALTGRKPKLKQPTRPQHEHPKRKNFKKKYKRKEYKNNRRRPDVQIVTKLPIRK